MNNKENIEKILKQYKKDEISQEQAVKNLQNSYFEDICFAKIDHERKSRQGFPEVVYCEGKTIEQIVAIIKLLAERNDNVLATRASKEAFLAVQKSVPFATYSKQARLIIIERKKAEIDKERYIAVVTAGTSDIAVAEESALTAEIMGNRVERVYDVGVAGIHRLFSSLDVVSNANVCIVVAGMEGALASVVGGLVEKPVIAVPTSVGYGANFGGLSALLAMLNSCAAGVGVVNIDNGFGAGRLANVINKMR